MGGLLTRDDFELRPQYRDASEAYLRRVEIAMLLALDVETCCSLLRGEQVHPSKLDRVLLRRLRREGLWRG